VGVAKRNPPNADEWIKIGFLQLLKKINIA